jgi:hypothetical protein
MKIKIRIAFFAVMGILLSIAICDPVYSGGPARTLASCASYNALDAKARAALSAGYLEGVQAAVDKEARDMLVPPWHEDHPIWWALPNGDVTADNLDASLAMFCNAAPNQDKRLPEAFLRVAARNDGAPRIGIPFSDGPSDRWRKIIEKSGPACSDYDSASDIERTNLIYGYFLGASAIKSILQTPPEQSVMVWPDTDYHEVKARVEAACRETRHVHSTLRDALWTTTAEMGAEKRIAGAK